MRPIMVAKAFIGPEVRERLDMTGVGSTINETPVARGV